MADVTETLLTSQEVDSRVAVLSFWQQGERSFRRLFEGSNAAHAGK